MTAAGTPDGPGGAPERDALPGGGGSGPEGGSDVPTGDGFPAGRAPGDGATGPDPAPRGRADAGDPDPSTDLVRFWYRRHADRVYRYARWRTGSRQAAEDVVSDVFLEVWRSSGSFDPERGSVESWLLGITRNVIARYERERAREAERRGGPELDDLASPDPGPEEETIRRRRVERMLEAVWELPPRDRDLVALAYGADLSRRRIARMMDVSPEAVRVRLHRVLGRLRQRLEGTD